MSTEYMTRPPNQHTHNNNRATRREVDIGFTNRDMWLLYTFLFVIFSPLDRLGSVSFIF